MRDEILKQLSIIEKKYGCRILYACESGSRAWGFHSPDSDYDVRFIYSMPLEWQLMLEEKRDTMERILPNDLDIVGWELKKALTLFAGCNLAMNEWFDSPCVYVANEKFALAVKALIPLYFNPRKACFHYGAIAKKTAAKHLSGTEVNIKKAFYMLRPTLAVQWILGRHAMPPTCFSELHQGISLPQEVSEAIDDLIVAKETALEGDSCELPRALFVWLNTRLESYENEAHELPVGTKPDWNMLNTLYRKWVVQA